MCGRVLWKRQAMECATLKKFEARERYREQRSKAHKSRKRSQHRYEANDVKGPRGRSQSLDAILEELNHPDSEADQSKGNLIPRAKLSASKGATGKIYTKRRFSQVAYDTNSLHAIHLQVEKKALEKSTRSTLKHSTSLPFFDQSEWIADMEPDRLSNGPPSYSTEFDACMRQLQGVHHSMESMEEMEVTTLPRHVTRDTEDCARSLTMPRARVQKRQMTPTKDSIVTPPEDTDTDDQEDKVEGESHTTGSNGESSCREDDEDTIEDSTTGEEAEDTVAEDLQEKEEEVADRIIIIEPEHEERKDKPKIRSDATHGWYTNLKDQFERLDKEIGDRVWKQESSCRITGATMKNCKEAAVSDDSRSATQRKHYFSQLVRSNKSLIDEELPDPDKVQNIRAMFQEQNTRLGGSLQNISTTKSVEVKPERPKSALGSRKEDELKCLGADDVDAPRRVEVKAKPGHDRNVALEKIRGRQRWTDSGSMSSGVSSDLSSCDTDLESCSRDADHTLSSDEDLEVVDRHYIQSEILEKIRSFGTSVTYFGGQMIRCSVGPLVSPTTHAILEEIGQKQPNGSAATRSFDEFYKKYKESSKKRKVGRTRSFAQEEMFQKSSVFNNMEIDEHKMELETAFGIRTPKGKLPVVKTKLGKSYSLDSRLQSFEKQIKDAGNDSFRREERSDTIFTQSAQPTVTINKYRVGNDFFDCNREIAPKKNEMDFEEFEVCENVYEKMEKMEMLDRRENGVIGEIGNECKRDKPHAEENNAPGELETREQTESLRSEDEDLTQSNLTSEKRENGGNSVQEKRNSYEEFIQRKRNSCDLNGGKTSKRSSYSSSNSSKRNSLEKENKDEGEINNIHVDGNLINGDNIKDEYKIRLKDGDGEDNNQDEEGFEVIQNSSRRNSTASKVSAWESFQKSRRYSSIENLNQIKSSDEQHGSRRGSLKKPIENQIKNDIVCTNQKRNSLDSELFNVDGKRHSVEEVRKPFEKEPNRRRSSLESRRNSTDSQKTKNEKNIEQSKGLIKAEKMLNTDLSKLNDTITNEGGVANNDSGYKITIKISQSDDHRNHDIVHDQFEEIVINDQDPPDSLEFYLPQKESAENNDKEVKGIQELVQDVDGALDYDRRQQRGNKNKQSLWPIETSVVTDMEKTEGTLPKLISNGKSHVKTTKRLY